MDRKEIFVEKARRIHGDKYDYSKVEYKGCNEKVCIICPEHGEFWQTPHRHIGGQRCVKCNSSQKRKKYVHSTSEFIEKAKQVHGDKYDYSKVEYVNCETKVCIICPEHGEFWQKPTLHLRSRGCNLCSKPVHDTPSFIQKARKVHGDKYDYSKVKYIDANTKVCIICPEHGEFWQTPHSHSQGQGCLICGKIQAQKANENRAKKAGETFIERARKVHGDKYDYSKVIYKNAHSKVCIICPEHGEFWQTPGKHVHAKEGCPKCQETTLEREVRQFLEKNNINYIQEYNTKWLGKQRLDFYLPEHSIAIECQGIQHYKPTDFGWYDEERTKQKFLEVLKNDYNKKRKCIEHNIDIVYYTNSELRQNNEFTNTDEILDYINKTINNKY